MFPPQSNSPVTELAADISSTDTTVMVVAGNLLPAAPNVATIGLDELAETIYYATKNGNELSGVIRGYDGTSPKGWNAGTRIARYLTAQDISALQHNVSDHETRINGISTATINKIEPRLVDDLPALYPIGLSLFSLTLEASAPWKTAIGHSGSGQTTLVQTAKANDDQYSIVQRVTFSTASGIEAMYERSSTVNNSWNGAWIKVVSRSEFDQLSTDVSAHLAEKANKRWFDVKDYGAVGDGVTDDTLAIQTAINSVIAVGGGLVYIPPGVYIVTSIHYGSNLTIQGSGIEVTILKLKDNSNGESVFNCNQEVANICIRDLTIDGNRDNQTVYGHGIRSGTEGGIVGGLFFNLYIKNTGAYGIGLQKGTFKNVRIENITTENTGLDGIDIKNISNNNDIIFCSNITIISPGRDLSQTMQVGIDCRGPVVLNNVIIRGLDGDRIGVRFRLTSVETGIGGGKSSLTNFSIYGNGPASGSTGIVVGDPDVRISNGYIFNADYGVVTEAAAQRVQISNVEVDTVNVNGMQIVAEFTKILGCIIRNSTINGIRVGANNIEIKDTTITGSLQQGIRLLAGLSGISLVGNDLRGNGTAAIRDDGASYTAINNKGWVTEANLVSADVDCSSAGDKLVTITHGLSVTPSLQDIILTPIISANSTYVLDNLGVVSVNGSIITAKVRVLTAQAGAVCKLAAQVRAKI